MIFAFVSLFVFMLRSIEVSLTGQIWKTGETNLSLQSGAVIFLPVESETLRDLSGLFLEVKRLDSFFFSVFFLSFFFLFLTGNTVHSLNNYYVSIENVQ